MPQPPPSSRSAIGSLLVIAGVVGVSAAAFAYTAGWLSPHRLTPTRMVDGFGPTTPEKLGHRRNHAKGICFTGVFDANGAGSALSKARVFAAGSYPVIGRFNLGTPNPQATDASVRVRGLSIDIHTPDGGEWRSGMISVPFFPVSNPQAFYALLEASGSKDPNAMGQFAAAHPEIKPFGAWAKTAPWTGSYAEERYNGVNAFLFTDDAGNTRAVRWTMEPAAQPVPVSPDELAKQGPDVLEKEITERIAKEPARWTLRLQVANDGDPTADPSKAWPADRRTVDAGTLVVQKIEPESDGPCRDINYDPTVLPAGVSTSDDPFPAARSAAYAKSYDLRSAEAAHYPRNDGKPEGATP
ncbi:catalase family peroxidase [Rhizosaccharibacter radicis]|uniref:Catalase-related peroxidase n=1 Tax=Rhizosaccharibacter radicis TaxID=2782605 RepID=A0ABT1VSL4_9PROT|nr:catalase family peroxidase [Acetobacteraceae bacterium KSS12]